MSRLRQLISVWTPPPPNKKHIAGRRIDRASTAACPFPPLCPLQDGTGPLPTNDPRRWGAKHNRIATWALFEAAGTPFLLLNTHLDHLEDGIRARQVRTIRKRLPALAQGASPAAVVVTGDMNCEPYTSPYQVWLPPLCVSLGLLLRVGSTWGLLGPGGGGGLRLTAQFVYRE